MLFSFCVILQYKWFAHVDIKSLGGALVLVLCSLVFVDPYLNTDAGTMSPFEHGEVFVLDDGGEV